MDFNSARDCLFDHWVGENCMREAHFDTAYVVEPLDLIRAATIGEHPGQLEFELFVSQLAV
jgi:hypothetical protein